MRLRVKLRPLELGNPLYILSGVSADLIDELLRPDELNIVSN